VIAALWPLGERPSAGHSATASTSRNARATLRTV